MMEETGEPISNPYLYSYLDQRQLPNRVPSNYFWTNLYFELTRRPYFKPMNVIRSLRTRIGGSNEVGVLAKLTNSYLLISGDNETDTFWRTVKYDCPEITVIRTSLAGCRVVGRLCVGNEKGLIIPEGTQDSELHQIKKKIPEKVEIRKVDDKLSALGNVIACNNNFALIHPELDKESEEIVADTLGVEVFRYIIGNDPLVGANCVFNNKGVLVNKNILEDQQEDLASLLQLPVYASTINGGNVNVASGLVVNDSICYAGYKTTTQEFKTIETTFNLKE